MAATVGLASGGSENVIGRQRVRNITITGDAAYPAGGYAISAQQCGLRNLMGMILLGSVTATLGLIPFWNTATGKLQIIDPTAASGPGPGSELNANTNCSTFVWTFMALSTDD